MNTARAKSRGVLVSIKPKFANKIVTGIKTVELRRKFPVETVVGGVALIYSSGNTKAIIGYAQIEDVHKMRVDDLWVSFGAMACINQDEFNDYFSGVEWGCAIILKDAERIRHPVPIFDMRADYGINPPQSYRYIDTEANSLWHDERLEVLN